MSKILIDLACSVPWTISGDEDELTDTFAAITTREEAL